MAEGAVAYDGEEFLPVPGMEGFYVSRSLRVLRDKALLGEHYKASPGRFIEKKVDTDRGFSIRFRKPGKKALKTAPVRRMLYAAQTGISMRDLERMPGLRLECTQLPDGTVSVRRSGSSGAAKRMQMRPKPKQGMQEQLDKMRQTLRMYEQMFEQGDPSLFYDRVAWLRGTLLPAYLQKNFSLGRDSAREIAAQAAESVIRCVAGGQACMSLEAYATAAARRICLAEKARKARQREIRDRTDGGFDSPLYGAEAGENEENE